MQQDIRQTRQRKSRKGKRKQRNWCNKDIKQAIQECKQALGYPQEAKILGLEQEEGLLRQKYREKDRVASELVQEEMKCTRECWAH